MAGEAADYSMLLIRILTGVLSLYKKLFFAGRKWHWNSPVKFFTVSFLHICNLTLVYSIRKYNRGKDNLDQSSLIIKFYARQDSSQVFRPKRQWIFPVACFFFPISSFPCFIACMYACASYTRVSTFISLFHTQTHTLIYYVCVCVCASLSVVVVVVDKKEWPWKNIR